MAFQLCDLYPLLVLAFYAKQFSLDASWFPFLEVWISTERKVPCDTYNFPDYCKLAKHIWETYRFDVHIIRECGSWLCMQAIGSCTNGYYEQIDYLGTKIEKILDKLEKRYPKNCPSIKRLRSLLTDKFRPLVNELVFVYKRGSLYFVANFFGVVHCTDIVRQLHTDFTGRSSGYWVHTKIKPILDEFGVSSAICKNQLQFTHPVTNLVYGAWLYDNFVLDASNPFPDPTIDKYCEQLRFLLENGVWPSYGPTQVHKPWKHRYICTERIISDSSMHETLFDAISKYNCYVNRKFEVVNPVVPLVHTPVLRSGEVVLNFHVKRGVPKYLKIAHKCEKFFLIWQDHMDYLIAKTGLEGCFVRIDLDGHFKLILGTPYITSGSDVFKPENFVPGKPVIEEITISKNKARGFMLTCRAGCYDMKPRELMRHLQERLVLGSWKLFAD